MITNEHGGKQSEIGFTLGEYLAEGILRAGRVAYAGEKKYGKGNPSKVTYIENIDHAIHHLLLARQEHLGESIPESEQGTDHLAHAACRTMMAMHVERKDGEEDTINHYR